MFDRTQKKGSQTKGQPTQPNSDGIPCFDDMMKLAKNNPAEFEAMRIRLCSEVIDSAPEYMQKRLEGLQFTIDMERKKAKSPMAACLKLSSMMNDSLVELSQVLSNPQEYRRNHPQQNAKVIPIFSGQ